MSDSLQPTLTPGELLAIDVGSSRAKFGWFPAAGNCDDRPKSGVLPIAAGQLPQPQETLAVSHCDTDRKLWSAELSQWLKQLPSTDFTSSMASVHPNAAAEVAAVLAENGITEVRKITSDDLSIAIEVEQPDRVGIDRLLNALAANRLRRAGQPAIVVDVGTAGKVDLIGAEGAFLGGAILPGISMSAAALHTGTATLPLLSVKTIEDSCEAVGKSTQQAIAAGLYWGAVGAVRELIHRLSLACDATPQVLLTGGDATRFVAELHSEDRPVRHVPHMVLAGICVAVREKTKDRS